MRDVSGRIAEMLRAGANDVVQHFARYTVHHDDTHTRQTLSCHRSPAPSATASADESPATPGCCCRRLGSSWSQHRTVSKGGCSVR